MFINSMDKQRKPQALLRCNSPQYLKNAKNTILLSSFVNYGVNIIQSHIIRRKYNGQQKI